MRWLCSKGIPSPVAVIIVVAAILSVLLAMGALVGTSLTSFTNALPGYEQRLADQMAGLLGWLGGLGIDVSNPSLVDSINPSGAMRLVSSILAGLGGLLSNALLIILTVVFILLEQSTFPVKIEAVFGTWDEIASPAFKRFAKNLNRYLAIKTLISLLTGILIGLWATVLGVDFPVLWGLLAFVLNYVPTLGSIIAAVPAVLLAYVQLGVPSALWMGFGFFAVNTALGSVLEPRIMGRGLGLSALVVFLSLLVWGWILGPVGMLLSVPLTMTAKIALESREDTRWIAVLLSSASSAEAVARAETEEEPALA
jgi:predicted PurR-regulated permease PerM